MNSIEIAALRIEIGVIKATMSIEQQELYNSTMKNIINQLPDPESGFRKSLLRDLSDQELESLISHLRDTILRTK